MEGERAMLVVDPNQLIKTTSCPGGVPCFLRLTIINDSSLLEDFPGRGHLLRDFFRHLHRDQKATWRELTKMEPYGLNLAGGVNQSRGCTNWTYATISNEWRNRFYLQTNG